MKIPCLCGVKLPQQLQPMCFAMCRITERPLISGFLPILFVMGKDNRQVARKRSVEEGLEGQGGDT